ncbi:tail fiber domain-containing protein [bacterium SCSIO 12643]|nr:tail fiber domain-containing protein [bacterium SCSIO 12643]
MKFNLLPLLTLFVLSTISYNSYSQIQVWQNSNITMGYANAQPTEKVNINGDFYIHPVSSAFGSSNSGFYFRNYHNNTTSTGGTGTTWFDEPILLPQFSKTAWIGNANNEIYRVFATRFYSPNPTVYFSDRRLKTNIKLWDGSALSKVMKLNAYRYDMDATKYENVPEEKKAEIALESSNQIGFIAQELQDEFPEMVTNIPGTEYLGVNYSMMIPVLLEAIKEQQLQIEELQKKLEEIQANTK